MNVIGQLVSLIAFKSINLLDCKEIMRLSKDDEELSDLLTLQPEEILKRWVNFYLEMAGQPKVNDLGTDLQDCKPLIYVLNQLDSQKCTLECLAEGSDAAQIPVVTLNNMRQLGCREIVGPNDIGKGNQ